MFANDHAWSTVTAIIPRSDSTRVLDAVLSGNDFGALHWQARGTLLHDRWWQRLVPPISPTKSVLQFLVPNGQVEALEEAVVTHAKLEQQAVGAVYSNRCEHVYIGADHALTSTAKVARTSPRRCSLKKDLSIIQMIVGHGACDRLARAAIAAGGHGPVVYFCEGRGLRDRLGWLRITSEQEKAVMMLIADRAQADDLFDAMAAAGEFHLPGRGLMYRLDIDKGLFHLPSRMSHRHHAASMQQIIHAIDHLQGHTHWRDQSAFDVASNPLQSAARARSGDDPRLIDQRCVTAVMPRDDSQALMDTILDAGAPGITVSHSRVVHRAREDTDGGARISDERTTLKCILDPARAAAVCAAIEGNAESSGVGDLIVTVNSVPRVARYLPGTHDYRSTVVEEPERERALS